MESFQVIINWKNLKQLDKRKNGIRTFDCQFQLAEEDVVDCVERMEEEMDVSELVS